MLGDLNKAQLLDFLNHQFIGRLGCSNDGETYVVPINYVYRENAIHAHSGTGKKIDMMRANPKVCFLIDEIVNTFNWKSAIIQGTFSELQGETRQQAMQGIIHKIMPLTSKPTQDPSHGINPAEHDNLIVYKIEFSSISGKYESHDDEA
ncbi:pyridoxamine 5'-phosphate oxidase family protein [Pedobacter lithocola]|uniref:Pyridoxamine 5'-phosphate oxidase family protein n=1 Tax=Pedobacter lithocola TaxID=1908239 RepID=A0ABV8PDX7_9SPHI